MTSNVLVYAHREDASDHPAYKKWLERMVRSEGSFAVSDLLLSGFLRVVTHPRVFDLPTPLRTALASPRRCATSRTRHPSRPTRHWEIFSRLCQAAAAKGNLVPDAYLAALAIESGCEWATRDRGYARFPGLRRRHPLD